MDHKKLGLWVALIAVSVLAVGTIAWAAQEASRIINVSGNYIEGGESQAQLGGVTWDKEIFQNDAEIKGDLTVEGNVVTGGQMASISTAVSTTLTAAQVCDYGTIAVTASGASIEVTMPSVADLVADCLTFDGATKEIYYANSSAAATTTTIIAPSGMQLTAVSTTDDVLAGGNSAIIRIKRITSSVLGVAIVKFIDAD
jgi:hypothetical protein